MTVHPTVTARYRAVRAKHKAVSVPGQHTAEMELRAIDPHGILSLAEIVGPDRAADLLRVRAAYATTTERGRKDG